MAMVKVWNDNTIDHTEQFKGETIKIPAGSFIEMELFDGNDFKGQYFPMAVDAGGQQTIESMKKIRIERITDEDGESDAPELHMCAVCKHKSPSDEELEAHINVRHADVSRLTLPEVDSKLKNKKANKKSA